MRSKIFVAGHQGLVGRAIVRRLERASSHHLVIRSHAELDLADQRAVRAFFEQERPEIVILAAAKVGGIAANQMFPADFLMTNLAIQSVVFEAACRYGVRRLLFFGSTCAYPKHSPQPMREEYLLTGPLEPTSEPYAIAKLAGMKACAAYNRQHGTLFLSIIPATLYGPGDNFDPAFSHVVSGLIRRLHDAKAANAVNCAVWGTGRARREFLHADDAAEACLFLLRQDERRLREELEPTAYVLNVGTGEDAEVIDLARLIAEAVGFEGELMTDPSKPDGAPRKLLDSSRMRALGWAPCVPLAEGIRATARWYITKHESRDVVAAR